MKKSHGLRHRHFAIFSRSRRNASKSFICCFEFTQSTLFMPKCNYSQEIDKKCQIQNKTKIKSPVKIRNTER